MKQLHRLHDEMHHLSAGSRFTIDVPRVNLLYLWHLLLCNNGVLGMQFLPDAKDCTWFSMSIDKATFYLSLFCLVVCSAQVFSRLLIVQVRLNQLEQLSFSH